MIYIYECDGKIIELVMTVAEMTRKSRKDWSIKLPDGRIATRRLDLEHSGAAGRPDLWRGDVDNWAVTVHPKQVAEVTELCRRNGVPTEHSRDGNPKFTSKKHRTEYLKVRNLVDRSSFD